MNISKITLNSFSNSFKLITLSSLLVMTASCGGGSSSSGGSSDSTPDAFAFTDLTDVDISTFLSSDVITISGIDTAATVSIVGGEFSIDGGAFTSTSTSINNNQTVQVRLTSDSAINSTTDAVLTIGGVSDTFSASTRETVLFGNFQQADVVIGQADFLGGSADQGGTIAANTIEYPYGNVAVHDGKLYVPDWGNNRILGFNAIPDTNNSSANFVIGQVDFTSSSTGLSASEFEGLYDVTIADEKMIVLSDVNSRVLIWNSVPTTNTAADVVVGKANFTDTDTSCTNSILESPYGSWVVDGKLIVSDVSQSRVLIWNSVPTSNGQAADLVLGQADFVNCTANRGGSASANTLSSPAEVWSDGTKLIVIDSGNHRALIWNTFPTSNGQAADLVLGQPDMTSTTANNGGVSASTLNVPRYGLDSNGQQLFIADEGNNRVLVWNTFPTSDGQAADTVIGQSNFTKITNNDENQDDVVDTDASAKTFSAPSGVTLIGNQLFVSDEDNHRYLIFNGQSVLHSLAGTYTVDSSSGGLIDPPTRASVIFSEDGSIDVDAGIEFDFSEVTEFNNFSHLSVGDKRLELSYPEDYEVIGAQPTIRIFLDAGHNVTSIDVKSEPGSSTFYNLTLTKQ